MREKPFLYLNAAGQYNVFVPALRSNTSGVSWPNAAGTSIPISNFLVVRADNFSVAVVNSALAAGQHVLFTPGVYHLNDTIRVTQPNTVVLGLGLATLSADTGLPAVSVADVDGVKIAHILFEAGATMSPSLLEVGPTGSGAGHAGNPSSLHDVFFRLGGAQVGQAQNSLTINSSDVIVDHTWLWRADHGTGVGWTVNVGNNGLVVNGNNATVYGLFSEHFEKYDVLWNGNNGRTYFLQNEMAYDVPNQASWMDGSSLGFAAYKVASTVTNHQAWGMGSYSLFLSDPSVHAAHGYESPTGAGIHFHHILTLSLGSGTIDHVINTTGDAAVASSVVPHNVVDYP
jgi:predicted heme/steroid binding protein